MITAIVPKLPMRNRQVTLAFYTQFLGFRELGTVPYPYYLMVERDGLEVHFFLHETLDPTTNDGQLYLLTTAIDQLYTSLIAQNTPIHPHGQLESKAWGQREFSVLDPDHNLLTFGMKL